MSRLDLLGTRGGLFKEGLVVAEKPMSAKLSAKPLSAMSRLDLLGTRGGLFKEGLVVAEKPVNTKLN